MINLYVSTSATILLTLSINFFLFKSDGSFTWILFLLLDKLFCKWFNSKLVLNGFKGLLFWAFFPQLKNYLNIWVNPILKILLIITLSCISSFALLASSLLRKETNPIFFFDLEKSSVFEINILTLSIKPNFWNSPYKLSSVMFWDKFPILYFIIIYDYFIIYDRV